MANKDTKKAKAVINESQATETPKIEVVVNCDSLKVGGVLSSKRKGFVLNPYVIDRLKNIPATAGEDSTSMYAHLLKTGALEERAIVEDEK